jgi:hypothetical protein
MGLVLTWKPFKIRGQFNFNFGTLMKPSNFNSNWLQKWTQVQIGSKYPYPKSSIPTQQFGYSTNSGNDINFLKWKF